MSEMAKRPATSRPARLPTMSSVKPLPAGKSRVPCSITDGRSFMNLFHHTASETQSFRRDGAAGATGVRHFIQFSGTDYERSAKNGEDWLKSPSSRYSAAKPILRFGAG